MKSRAAVRGEQPDTQPDTSDWMTRYELVQATGIGLSTIPALERRGLLHPHRVYRRDTRGAERSTMVYSPDEIAKLPKRGRTSSDRSPGETTARAFGMFREAKTDEEIVIELRETVEQVQELREQWSNAGGASWVIVPMARVALEKLVGPFNSVTDLVDNLQLRLKPAPADPGLRDAAELVQRARAAEVKEGFDGELAQVLPECEAAGAKDGEASPQ